MVHVQYRPDPPDEDNPFVAGLDGQGPSSRNWSRSHLKWLGFDYSDGWPLYGTDSIFGDKISASSMSRIRSSMEERTGRTWQDILVEPHLDPHYAGLFELSELRRNETINCIPSSSAVKPSQDWNETGLEQDDRALYPLTSPCTLRTPTRPFTVGLSTLSPRSQTTPLSCEAGSVPAVLMTETARAMMEGSLTTESGQTQSPYCHEESGRRTEPPSVMHYPQKRELTITPSRLCTPIAQGRTTRREPRSTCSALELSALPLSSPLTDSSYVSVNQPEYESPKMTEDKPELEVMIAGWNCLTAVQKVLEDSSGSQLSSTILVPKGLRLSVGGLLINCYPDLVTRVLAANKKEEMKRGEAYGEVLVPYRQQHPSGTNRNF